MEVDEVPEILRKLDHIHRLVLTFKGEVNLPEWLRDMDIEDLVVYGKISKAESRRLKQKFAHIQIYPQNV